MAGHSHWSTIKRAKGANDARRGKIWSKIARKIIIAAKNGGDPRDNLALRYVVDEAKEANMPRATIENAIKKGTGELDTEDYQDATYEGYGPGGVAVFVEALTNNRSRTAPDLRAIFERAGGNLATNGAVAFQFNKQGLITVKAEVVEEEALMELALDAGAEDVKNEGEVYVVVTAPAAFHKVKEALEAAKVAIEASTITHVPTTTVAVEGETAQRVLKLIATLDDNDDVQTVSHNADIPESISV